MPNITEIVYQPGQNQELHQPRSTPTWKYAALFALGVAVGYSRATYVTRTQAGAEIGQMMEQAPIHKFHPTLANPMISLDDCFAAENMPLSAVWRQAYSLITDKDNRTHGLNTTTDPLYLRDLNRDGRVGPAGYQQ